MASCMLIQCHEERLVTLEPWRSDRRNKIKEIMLDDRDTYVDYLLERRTK